MGSDKGSLRAEEMVPSDLNGKPLEGEQGPPVEWPIHTALHGARPDALAVAHLHTPYATLFTIAKRKFQPVTLQGAIFSDGVPLYPEAQLITNPARGEALLESHRRQTRRAVARPRHRGRRQKSPGSALQRAGSGRRRQKILASGGARRSRHHQRGRMPRLRRRNRVGAARPKSVELLRQSGSALGSPTGDRDEANCFRRSDEYRSNRSKRSSGSSC